MENLKAIESSEGLRVISCLNFRSMEGLDRYETNFNVSIGYCNNIKNLKGMSFLHNGDLKLIHCHRLSSLKGMPLEINGNLQLGGLGNLNSLNYLPAKISGTIGIMECKISKYKKMVWETTMSEEEAKEKVTFYHKVSKEIVEDLGQKESFFNKIHIKTITEEEFQFRKEVGLDERNAPVVMGKIPVSATTPKIT